MYQLCKYYFILILLTLSIISCKTKKSAEDAPAKAETRVPVTTTTISYDAMEDFVMLNATSTYLQKSFVKANATGYVMSSAIKLYSFVNNGQQIFAIKTKEAASIGNSINKLDPSFHFSGVNTIHAKSTGYVTELNHQTGDYVQDNEQLAVISAMNSFVFLLDLPYEYKSFVTTNKTVEIILPGGEKLKGIVMAGLPVMDSLSQTQGIVVKPQTTHSLPQNLVAKIKIIKSYKAAASGLLKSAVLSNETQSSFWVMKLINDSTAVKVEIKKGIEVSDKVEIISPSFQPSDKFLLTGNYGLGDTAKVVITAK